MVALKRILVTGANGFVGRSVLALLSRQPHISLAALVRRPPPTSTSTHYITGDYTKPETYSDALAKFSPHILIHLAWQGIGSDYWNHRCQQTNRDATLQLFEAARLAGAIRFIGLGSQAEYGVCSGPAHEKTPTDPCTLYGRVKLQTCQDVLQWGLRMHVATIWVRLFSCYGPYDHEFSLIPYLVKTLLHGQSPQLTKGTQMWDYLYVQDVARALYILAEHPKADGIYNLGSGKAMPLRDIICKVRDNIDPSLPLMFGTLPFRPNQAMHLEAVVGRLSGLDWWPKVDLERGLETTVRHLAGRPQLEL